MKFLVPWEGEREGADWNSVFALAAHTDFWYCDMLPRVLCIFLSLTGRQGEEKKNPAAYAVTAVTIAIPSVVRPLVGQNDEWAYMHAARRSHASLPKSAITIPAARLPWCRCWLLCQSRLALPRLGKVVLGPVWVVALLLPRTHMTKGNEGG